MDGAQRSRERHLSAEGDREHLDGKRENEHQSQAQRFPNRARFRTDGTLNAGRFIRGSHRGLLASRPRLQNDRHAHLIHWALARQVERGAVDIRAFLAGIVPSRKGDRSRDSHESLTSKDNNRGCPAGTPLLSFSLCLSHYVALSLSFARRPCNTQCLRLRVCSCMCCVCKKHATITGDARAQQEAAR